MLSHVSKYDLDRGYIDQKAISANKKAIQFQNAAKKRAIADKADAQRKLQRVEQKVDKIRENTKLKKMALENAKA